MTRSIIARFDRVQLGLLFGFFFAFAAHTFSRPIFEPMSELTANPLGRHSWPILVGCSVIIVVFGARHLWRIVRWSGNAAVLEGDDLRTIQWKTPLDMASVERLTLVGAGFMAGRPSSVVFHLRDGTQRKLLVGLMEESSRDVATDLGTLYRVSVDGLPDDDPSLS